jgi:hypothetical protein
MLPNKRQIHVQEVQLPDGRICAFAHTEPAGYGLRHFLSYLFRGADWVEGDNILREDLCKMGWKDPSC